MLSFYNIVSDKLHLNPEGVRLSETEYKTAKDVRFQWWPGSKQFVAKWSPEAEDFVQSLNVEIEENDNPDDVEGRVERFAGYAERAEDGADSARDYLEERANTDRRRRLAARAINRNLEAAQHWQRRIEGAIRHAQYKERPDVIARRIKGLETEERKFKESVERHETYLKLWNRSNLNRSMAVQIAIRDRFNYEVRRNLDNEEYTAEAAQSEAVATHEKALNWARRWVEHIAARLEYERALLLAAGGLPADAKPLEVGGAIRGAWQNRGEWSMISKVNKATVEILFRTSGFTRESGYKEHSSWTARGKVPKTDISAVMTAAEVAEFEGFIYAREEVQAPKETAATEPAVRIDAEAVSPEVAALALRNHEDRTGQITRLQPVRQAAHIKAAEIQQERQAATARSVEIDRASALRALNVPGFFPTPRDLVECMIEAADLTADMSVLEPSAGTGNIALAAVEKAFYVVALEINLRIFEELEIRRTRHPRRQDVRTLHVDFLEWCARHKAEPQLFDRVIMNPPFERGQDIDHVRAAFEFLKPGGRLVAIMSPGTFYRSDNKAKDFRAWFDALDGQSQDLEAGTFNESGTNVATCFVVIDKPMIPAVEVEECAPAEPVAIGVQLALF